MLHPYSPMQEPRKEVTTERMQEILAKHSRKTDVQPTVEAAPATAVSQSGLDDSAPAQLVWKKPVRNADGTGYLETECGLYTVDKAFVMGKPRYTAWRRAPDWVFNLGCKDCASAAQALCQQHAERK